MEKNPYRPGAAVQPGFLAGRDELREQFKQTLTDSPEIPASARITGLRGVGKTVLLKSFEEDAQELGWMTAFYEVLPKDNTTDALASVVEGLCEYSDKQASALKRAIGRASPSDGQVTVGHGDLFLSVSTAFNPATYSLAQRLASTVSLVRNKGYSGLAILLDEAQVLRDSEKSEEYPLSTLISAVNEVQQRGFPLALVVCGLPTLHGHLQKARTYSERMFTGVRVTNLGDSDAHEALMRPLDSSTVSMHGEALEAILAAVDGYPYFLQLWGSMLWLEAKRRDGTIDAALVRDMHDKIYDRLDSDFFEGRVATLQPAQQDLLMMAASINYPPLQVSDMQAASHKSVGNVNVQMGRLVEAGVIYREAKGRYRYTAPGFHSFLRRRVERLHDEQQR